MSCNPICLSYELEEKTFAEANFIDYAVINSHNVQRLAAALLQKLLLIFPAM